MTVRKILTEVADLKEKKSQDYQGGLFEESDYFPYGQQSFNHMLWTKILRIRSITEQDQQNFESLEDSLKDLIAYAAMNVAWLREEKPSLPTSEKTIDELRGRSPRNSVTYRDV